MNFPVGWKGTRITSFRPDAEKGGGSQSDADNDASNDPNDPIIGSWKQSLNIC
jgi:hypothetical protein